MYTLREDLGYIYDNFCLAENKQKIQADTEKPEKQYRTYRVWVPVDAILMLDIQGKIEIYTHNIEYLLLMCENIKFGTQMDWHIRTNLV